MHPDESYMVQVRDGDLRKVSELYHRYHVKLYNFFLKLTRDRSLSEDLTQNVFERVIKYRESYKDDFPFKAWIYRIAYNVKHDHFRSQKLHIAYDQTYESAQITESSPEKSDFEEERISKLKLAMKGLNDEQKKVIWLTKYEGMKYIEAARVIGCTESAFKVKVHRAMKHLKSNYFKMN
jgi:RNA polymerase sigma-70 factor (ECF subfamily)